MARLFPTDFLLKNRVRGILVCDASGHRRNRVPMVRHPEAHQGYRRSRHAPSRNGLTRQHPERRLSTTLLLEKQGAVDNNRRYVSPRVRRKSFARASVGIFPGQIFQKEVSLPTLLTYRRFMSKASRFQERKRGDRLALAETLRKQSCSMVDEVQRQAS